MKKFISLLLCIILIFTASSCMMTEVLDEKFNGKPTTKDYLSDSYIDPLYSWDQYDNLLSLIRFESNGDARTEYMHRAEDILMATGNILPLFYHNDLYMCKPYLSKVYTDCFGNKYFNRATLSNGASLLKIGSAYEPETLDPSLYTLENGIFSVNLFSGLYTYNNEGTIAKDMISALSQTATKSDGSTTYRIELKPNLKWSDGTSLTATDFVYSWNRAAQDSLNDNSYLFSLIKGYPNELDIKIIDQNTFDVTLNRPCQYINQLLASPVFYPVKQASIQSNASGWAKKGGFPTCGPYICTEWSYGNYMVLEKNPNYHNKQNVKIEKIIISFTANATETYNGYVENKFDFIDEIPEKTYKLIADNEELVNINTIGTYFLVINASGSAFYNMPREGAACLNVALQNIIDRPYIVDSVMESGQTPANSLLPIGISDGNYGIFKKQLSSNAYYDANAINTNTEEIMDRCQKYLDAAGFVLGDDGKVSSTTPIVLNFLTVKDTYHAEIAKLVKEDIEALGIGVSIEEVDWATFIEKRQERKYDITFYNWFATYDDPESFLELFETTSSNNGCNFGKNENYELYN